MDDNKICSIANNFENLILKLECASGEAINWFTNNTVIVNLNKFQTIIIDLSKTNYNPPVFNKDGKEIDSQKSYISRLHF